jgi:hypothetical protein
MYISKLELLWTYFYELGHLFISSQGTSTPEVPQMRTIVISPISMWGT